MSVKYKRILLKLSGEALQGEDGYGINPDVLSTYASEIKQVVELGVQVALVIGGGNIFRGVQNATTGMTRAHADYMGMLATMINAMALQDALEQAGLQTRLQSSIKMEQIAEPFIRRRAMRHLEKNRIVIFGAGTGNPYFTTDTAAALRALEIDADVILKGTKVDGVYTADPNLDSSAEQYTSINGADVIQQGLKVMDMTAFTLCGESKMPIIVFNITERGILARIVKGDDIGTLVHWEDRQADIDHVEA